MQPSELGAVAVATNAHTNVFMPEKKRRQRDGYAEGDYILHKTMSASDFIRCPDPVAFLGSINRISFTSDEEKEYVFVLSCRMSCSVPSRWAALPITTPDVKTNCEDLKVLGRGDFKALIKWRATLREEVGD